MSRNEPSDSCFAAETAFGSCHSWLNDDFTAMAETTACRRRCSGITGSFGFPQRFHHTPENGLRLRASLPQRHPGSRGPTPPRHPKMTWFSPNSSHEVHRSPFYRANTVRPLPEIRGLPSARSCHAPNSFRPCRFSRLRRFAPHSASRVYCTPQPAIGFAWFGTVPQMWGPFLQARCPSKRFPR